jgi:hypothetical protein
MYLILLSQIIFMAQKYQGLMQKAKSELKSLDSELSKRVVPAYWKRVEEKDPYTHSWQHENTIVSYMKSNGSWVVVTKTEGSDEKTIGTYKTETDARYKAIEIMREML